MRERTGKQAPQPNWKAARGDISNGEKKCLFKRGPTDPAAPWLAVGSIFSEYLRFRPRARAHATQRKAPAR
jgi:hypothetical protein